VTDRVQILCVDDEPEVLETLSLALRRSYYVLTATGGDAGLETLGGFPHVAVVLSDMQMPGMNGATFLAQVRRRRPDAVRLLLTGASDIQAAAAVVNEGQIFRFLTKPWSPETLVGAVTAAVEQHRLITAERVLLEQTLRGSIKVLTEVLALANPTAFGRATRIKNLAVELASAAGVEPLWQIEVAALLSQLGCVALPDTTVDKLYLGERLDANEQEAVDRLPELANALLEHIPRLEEIRSVILHHRKRFDAAATSRRPSDEGLPRGARVIRIAVDYDALEAQGCDPDLAVDTMVGRTGLYDPHLLEVFAKCRAGATRRRQVREIPIRLVTAGMRFAQDVRTSAGALLLPRGYEVTDALLTRIRSFPVKGDVRVLVSETKPRELGTR
jgi:response regulator RpfG family c-di-GMP phosphodiesterase